MSYDNIFDDIQAVHERWDTMYSSAMDSLGDNPLIQFFSHPLFERLFAIVAFLLGSSNVWLDFIFQSSAKSFLSIIMFNRQRWATNQISRNVAEDRDVLHV